MPNKSDQNQIEIILVPPNNQLLCNIQNTTKYVDALHTKGTCPVPEPMVFQGSHLTLVFSFS